jgi:hypothetical protein
MNARTQTDHRKGLHFFGDIGDGDDGCRAIFRHSREASARRNLDMKAKPGKGDVGMEEERSVDPEALETASDETARTERAPELTPETEELTEWDDPVGASGAAAPKVLVDDEAGESERLVEEGVEEAERDRRMAAADPDLEP